MSKPFHRQWLLISPKCEAESMSSLLVVELANNKPDGTSNADKQTPQVRRCLWWLRWSSTWAFSGWWVPSGCVDLQQSHPIELYLYGADMCACHCVHNKWIPATDRAINWQWQTQANVYMKYEDCSSVLITSQSPSIGPRKQCLQSIHIEISHVKMLMVSCYWVFGSSSDTISVNSIWLTDNQYFNECTEHIIVQSGARHSFCRRDVRQAPTARNWILDILCDQDAETRMDRESSWFHWSFTRPTTCISITSFRCSTTLFRGSQKRSKPEYFFSYRQSSSFVCW